jgi:hypothetical protein
MLRFLTSLITILTLLAFGFLAGHSYAEATRILAPPSLSVQEPLLVPSLSIDGFTAEYIELSSSHSELRVFTDAGVLVPDESLIMRIPLPPNPQCSIPQSSGEAPCVFVAKPNGRVYYRAESKRRCFGTQAAAEQAGYKASTTL